MLKRSEYMICLFLTLVVVFSCDVVSDYDSSAIGVGRCSSIAYIKSVYDGYPHTFSDEIFIKGVVTANDQSGNIYKKLVVEDLSGGVEIKLDKLNLSDRYMVGDSVMINCQGLTLGAYGGMLQIGGPPVDGYETSYIKTSDIDAHLMLTGGKSPQVEAICLTVEELTSSHISRYVEFVDVQFSDESSGCKWTDSDQTTNRTLVDRNGCCLIVRTLSQALFADELLPQGSGSVSGILSFFNGTYQLSVIDLTDVELDDVRF